MNYHYTNNIVQVLKDKKLAAIIDKKGIAILAEELSFDELAELAKEAKAYYNFNFVE